MLQNPTRPGLLSFSKPFSTHFALRAMQILWLWLTLTLAFYVSWITLSKVDFLYGTWYEVGDFETHINHYAPQNRFRHGFEQTDKTTRLALFGGIVEAIHHQGNGLKQLHYTDAKNRTIPLLHQSEVVHLKDVANLIDFLSSLGWGLALAWLIITAILLSKRHFPNIKTSLLQIGLTLMAIGLLIAAVGAKEIFYQLHIWIFPADHRWFFYYQDSLMSTLMKAPDLFAYIAASLTALSLLCFMLVLMFFHLPIIKNVKKLR
ncbi:lipoprotein intramolecular transacylase Lit [Thiomicrorhabdus cannonii]|uniref:lipoprotein intramolecular transacylase Lit n=1 Tax=Thiomicrorhabdus cannonii TaxID=2748011 RepID=UPI0015C151A7|nr:DUF1461 domain-containing protein [Thiomicrorhabdus cannonii]